MCCGQKMEALVPNTTNAAGEEFHKPPFYRAALFVVRLAAHVLTGEKE